MSEAKSSETLATALVAAQTEMPAVERDGTNPHFGSSFVTLSKLIASVRPVLNDHGIAVVQMPSQDEQGRPALTTRLIHEGGESIEATMPLLMTKSDPQSLGSALTYAKRYALAAVLAIADQEDDDGNAAAESEKNGGSSSPGPVSAKQSQEFTAILKDAGLGDAEIAGICDFAMQTMNSEGAEKTIAALKDAGTKAECLKWLRDKAEALA